MEINKLYNGDILEMFAKTPDNFVDLIVTSPPYNVGINYSDWDDTMSYDGFFQWVETWLKECYRTLKPDGRIAINIPYETNFQERGGRVFFTADFYAVMKKVGFNLFGLFEIGGGTTLETVTGLYKFDEIFQWATIIIEFYFGGQLAKSN